MTTRTRTRHSLAFALAAALAAGLVPAGVAVAHGPDPVAERRAVRAEPGAPFPVAVGRGTDRDHQDRDQGGRVRRDEHPRIEGGDLRLRLVRRQPDRLRRGCAVRRQRPRLLHEGCPERIHDVAA